MESRPHLKGDLKTIGCGVLMGAADIVPGVSGGTVALILGIYHRLVAAISRIDSTAVSHVRRRRWRDAAEHIDLRFLVTLACGIVSGVACLAFLMHYLLENERQATYAVFFGLILGSGIIVGRNAEHWRRRDIVAAVAGCAFAAWIVGLKFLQSPPEGLVYLFLCGCISICAMILPGISGSFILLILGRYHYVTGLIRDFLKGNWSVETFLSITVFAVGCLFGLLAFSRVLRSLLEKHATSTMATLCGFMLGSLRRLWPFKVEVLMEGSELRLVNVLPPAVDGDTLFTIGLAIIALVGVLTLAAISSRHRTATALGETTSS